MSFSLFDKTKIPILSKALDAYSLRHKASASNIANIGTDGYRSQTVKFEEKLSDAMEGKVITAATTNERHIGTGPLSLPDPELTDAASAGGAVPADGSLASGVNNVDIDQEMLELAKNQIRFKFAARALNETFRGLQKSIRGQQ